MFIKDNVPIVGPSSLLLSCHINSSSFSFWPAGSGQGWSITLVAQVWYGFQVAVSQAVILALNNHERESPDTRAPFFGFDLRELNDLRTECLLPSALFCFRPTNTKKIKPWTKTVYWRQLGCPLMWSSVWASRCCWPMVSPHNPLPASLLCRVHTLCREWT